MARDQDFITEARTHNRAIWKAIHDAKSRMQSEWNASDFGNALADGNGENTGVTKAETGAFVFDTINMFYAIISGGTVTVLVNGQSTEAQIPPGFATNMANLL